MKVYVDELPKSCSECRYVSYLRIDDVFRCGICDHKDYIEVDEYKKGIKISNCPLQSLTDYTKQTRKEVVEEIEEMLKDKQVVADGLNCQYVCYYKEDIDEILNQIQEKPPTRKNIFKNYSGFDLLNDLTKPCKKCGCKPTIGNIYGYKEKYQLACMNCTCTNMKVVSDENFYKVIDKWNEIQGERK